MKYLGLGIALLGLIIILTACDREPRPVPKFEKQEIVCVKKLNEEVLVDYRYGRNEFFYNVVFSTGAEVTFREHQLEHCSE